MKPARLIAGLALATSLAACALAGGTLGGRQKCWPESDPRMPSLWRGVLEITASSGQLNTPEGDVIPLLPGTLYFTLGPDGGGQLMRGADVVARAGEDVTLFGGAGGDGTLLVCDVEEKH